MVKKEEKRVVGEERGIENNSLGRDDVRPIRKR